MPAIEHSSYSNLKGPRLRIKIHTWLKAHIVWTEKRNKAIPKSLKHDRAPRETANS